MSTALTHTEPERGGLLPPELEAAATQLLLLPGEGSKPDTLMLDRARRLVGLIPTLAQQPEMAKSSCDRRAVEVAAMFYEVGRAKALAQGGLRRHAALLGPCEDAQREQSIDELRTIEGELRSLPTSTLDRAVAAMRQWSWTQNASPEAIVLAEAVNLDDLGPLWIWYQAQRAGGERESESVFLATWRMRQQYGYWSTRIRDSLRFDWSRQLAKRRVAAMQVFIESLEDQVAG